MRKKQIVFLTITFFLCLLAGCGGGTKGTLNADQSGRIFSTPEDFVGYQVTLSGQVSSEPKLIDNAVYGFRILTGDNQENQAIIYTEDIDDLEKYDVVSLEGTIFTTKIVSTSQGDLNLPLLHPTDVKVTDTSYRSAALEEQQQQLEAMRQELLTDAQSLQAQNDAGNLNRDEYSKLNQDKEKYEALKSEYDNRLAAIEKINN